jgi:hypothetical protein
VWPCLHTRLGEIPESSNRSFLSIKERKRTDFDPGLSARVSIVDVLLTALSALRLQDERIFLLSGQPYFSEVRSAIVRALPLVNKLFLQLAAATALYILAREK